MLIRDIMTTKLVTVTPDDTLSHAANLLRQHQFHHLAVTRTVTSAEHRKAEYTVRHTLLVFEGLLTSQDIELAAAGAQQEHASEVLHRPWQEQHVGEFMHSAPLRVTPTTSVGAAVQVLVERGLTSLPVVEEQQIAPFLVCGTASAHSSYCASCVPCSATTFTFHRYVRPPAWK